MVADLSLRRHTGLSIWVSCMCTAVDRHPLCNTFLLYCWVGDTGAELLERWKEVVDEATAMHKLKSILTYRRKAAEMRERAKKDSGE